ncbi:MAG: NUDIX domain-containing protein [Myxococcota bacterium]
MSPYMRQLRDRVGNALILIPGVAAVVHDDEGRVLVLRTTEGFWSLPAGAIDPGESPREAVVRETQEESGLEVKPVELLDVLGGLPFRHRYRNGDEVEATICVFRCEIVGGALHCDGVETTEARWVTADEAVACLPLPFPRELFVAANSHSER